MYFWEGAKNKIKELRALGDHEGVKRELLKVKLSRYEELEFQDKIAVDYYLAWYASLEKNEDLLGVYLNQLSALFNSENIQNYRIEYYRFLWLMINSNYKSMKKEEVMSAMMEIHNFYKMIGDYDTALAASTNIYAIYKDGYRVLEALRDLTENNKNVDENILNSFLDGLTDLDENLYIEGKDIIKKYILKTKVI